MLITAAITKRFQDFPQLIYIVGPYLRKCFKCLFVFKLRASYVSPQIVSALVVVGVEEFVPQ